ncbi:hypothetical protein BDC45DRAFT_339337 [Circinella umbellata]|nr:hypothetical protein BDC45DRAFT_339337 [Circinella umbellata]
MSKNNITQEQSSSGDNKVQMAPAEKISEQDVSSQEYHKTIESLHVAQKETNEEHKKRITKMQDAHAQVLAGLQEQLKNTEAKYQKEIITHRIQQSDTIQAELETLVTSLGKMSELLDNKEDDKNSINEVITAKNSKQDQYGSQPKNGDSNSVSQQTHKELKALQTKVQNLIQLTSNLPIHDQQDKTGFAEHRPQQSANKNLEPEV